MYFSYWNIITVGKTEMGCTPIGQVLFFLLYALQSFDHVIELVSPVNGITARVPPFLSALKQGAEHLDIHRLTDLCSCPSLLTPQLETEVYWNTLKPIYFFAVWGIEIQTKYILGRRSTSEFCYWFWKMIFLSAWSPLSNLLKILPC